MSLDHREGLVRIAREFDALVITDDVYDFLQWPCSPSDNARLPSHACVPRIVDVDGCGHRTSRVPVSNFPRINRSIDISMADQRKLSAIPFPMEASVRSSGRAVGRAGHRGPSLLYTASRRREASSSASRSA